MKYLAVLAVLLTGCTSFAQPWDDIPLKLPPNTVLNIVPYYEVMAACSLGERLGPTITLPPMKNGSMGERLGGPIMIVGPRIEACHINRRKWDPTAQNVIVLPEVGRDGVTQDLQDNWFREEIWHAQGRRH